MDKYQNETMMRLLSYRLGEFLDGYERDGVVYHDMINKLDSIEELEEQLFGTNDDEEKEDLKNIIESLSDDITEFMSYAYSDFLEELGREIVDRATGRKGESNVNVEVTMF